MNIIFYLVLAAIAILGVLALVLIFWGRFKLPQKKSKSISDEIASAENEEKYTEGKWEGDIYGSDKIMATSAVMRDDPSLGDIGFSAIDDLLESDDDAAPVKTVAPKAPIKRVSTPNELIVFYVLADPQQPFVGYELLQTLLSAGLRYGEMNIFHYHQQTPQGQGEPLFSLASAVEPGVFDLANVGAIVCPGLTLFMSQQVDNPVNTFEVMLETAQQLADDLNGVLCDMQRLPLTETKIAQYRSKIFEGSF